MQDEKRNDLIAQEYLQLQKVVEDYDLRVITIKAWSVTFSAAGLGAAYLQGQPVLLLISALSALVFWIVEGLWKTNQQAYYPRIKQIENYFAKGATEAELAPFSIRSAWRTAFRAKRGYRRALRIMFWPHVALPHAVVMVAALALLVLSQTSTFFAAKGSAADRTEMPEITPRPSEERR
ncbi:MAG: hypothetical protein M3N07_05285 [Pseudomonadota bacterium]|nr:hypothetical protein [Pseudomonadota bacterium]